MTHVTIPVEVYSIPKLDEIQRAVLGLAMTFDEVRVGDNEFAGLFGKSTRWINGRIRDLKDRGFITIEKAQSRHRVIRLLGSIEVPSKGESTKKSDVPSRGYESHSLLGSPEVPLTRKSRGSDIKKKKVKRTPSPSPDDTFFRFWNVYPKRVDKQEARKVWGKLEPNGELPAILAAAAKVGKMAEAGKFAGPDGWLQFCKRPARWLRAGCWEDEPDEVEADYGTHDATPEEITELEEAGIL